MLYYLSSSPFVWRISYLLETRCTEWYIPMLSAILCQLTVPTRQKTQIPQQQTTQTPQRVSPLSHQMCPTLLMVRLSTLL